LYTDYLDVINRKKEQSSYRHLYTLDKKDKSEIKSAFPEALLAANFQ
jgi:hypothetical protein